MNPMGREALGPEFFETRLTDYLQEFFEELGVPFQRQVVDPGRENIIARLEGEPLPRDGGQVLLLDAHQDTVPVEGMTIDPWTPVVRDGRLYGRGACDTKGSMAAMLTVLARLARHPAKNRPTLLVSCPVNEEFGFTGAWALTRLWDDAGSAADMESIVPRRPDAAIVGEPTGLQVVVAHKGAVRWNCRTRGQAGHSSNPASGENAIYRMARVLLELERYAKEGVQHLPAHLLCGQATLSVGTIHGGVSVNTIPDFCSAEIDRRVLPGEDTQQAYLGVIDYLKTQGRFDFAIEHTEPTLRLPALSETHNGLLGDWLADVIGQVTGGCRKEGVAYGTHAAVYAAAGVPSVVFGPGFIEQAHTADEWLPLDQLERATEVLFRAASRPLPWMT
ncbi:MAG: M20 family metallopeptidase [Pirellulales bacterium]|nr:M20 family metallopeptidase [Pirellulales bacterium]